MLLPTTTWGDIKKLHIELGLAGMGGGPDDLLSDPKFAEIARGKENDEYLDPEAAKYFLEEQKKNPPVEEEDGPEPVTAAGEPLEENLNPEADLPSPLYYTVNDDGLVLELVKADDEGLFIRLDSEWVDISDEDEFPTVYEQDMHFANDQSVSIWDSEMEDNDDLRLEDIEDYIIK